MINDIKTLVQLILVCFCILGTITLLASIIYIISMVRSLRKRQSNYIMAHQTNNVDHTGMHQPRTKVIDEAIDQLITTTEPNIQGCAFVKLMRHGLILLHILQNKGNCYNDNKQPEKYNSFLTPDCVNVLFDLEGENAGYQF